VRRSVEGIAAGMHVLLRLSPGIDDQAVAAQAERVGVRVAPLSRFALGASSAAGLVLGYGRIHEQALDVAVAALAGAVRSAERGASR
jgi:GntR family transcriptional regulator / MocR family aminotransferase